MRERRAASFAPEVERRAARTHGSGGIRRERRNDNVRPAWLAAGVVRGEIVVVNGSAARSPRKVGTPTRDLRHAHWCEPCLGEVIAREDPGPGSRRHLGAGDNDHRRGDPPVTDRPTISIRGGPANRFQPLKNNSDRWRKFRHARGLAHSGQSEPARHWPAFDAAVGAWTLPGSPLPGGVISDPGSAARRGTDVPSRQHARCGRR